MFQRFVPATTGSISALTDAGEQPIGKGSFVTEQTLASFVGASAVVVIAWKLLAQLDPLRFGNRMNAVWIAFVVGAAVLFLSWPIKSDGKAVSIFSRAGVSALIVGAFNSLILAAASIGIDVTGVPTP